MPFTREELAGLKQDRWVETVEAIVAPIITTIDNHMIKGKEENRIYPSYRTLIHYDRTQGPSGFDLENELKNRYNPKGWDVCIDPTNNPLEFTAVLSARGS